MQRKPINPYVQVLLDAERLRKERQRIRDDWQFAEDMKKAKLMRQLRRLDVDVQVG